MSIYDQPNSYECGPFALKHALLVLGVFESERRLARLAGTDRGGTDEAQLARAAQRLGFELPTERVHDAREARRALSERLGAGNPVLLCVDQWEHWITVAGESDGRLVVFDSAVPGVVHVVEWDALCARWAFRQGGPRDQVEELFDLNPLIPRITVPARARLAPDVALRLANGGQRELVRDWSQHARDLLDLSRAHRGEVGHPDTVPLATLLDELTARPTTSGDGHSDRGRVIGRLRLVSATYGLAVGRRAARLVLRELADVVRRLSR
jgi:hypothetical protein